MHFNEYLPSNSKSWYDYNRKQARKEKVGIALTVLCLLIGYCVVGYIEVAV